MEEEVSRWAQIWEERVASWHIQALPHMYMWVGFSLFLLEFGGQTAYMKTY